MLPTSVAIFDRENSPVQIVRHVCRHKAGINYMRLNLCFGYSIASQMIEALTERLLLDV